MTPPSPSSWVALCAKKDLGPKPRRFEIHGQGVVLFKTEAGIAALNDICPHRFAPLSLGRVKEDLIECPYHGWAFDGFGLCQRMPGHMGDLPRVRVPNWAVRDFGGLIFVSAADTEDVPYAGRCIDEHAATHVTDSQVKAQLADVAENILDATHTHFTHKGLLRGLTSKRYKVNVTITSGKGWVEARYEGEPRQDGLISTLLEGARGISIGRFMAPGIAEIEFWGPQNLNLVTTFHLRQARPDTVAGLAVLSGPPQGGYGHLKGLLFRPLFHIALAQDQHILSRASLNRQSYGDPKPVIGPLDILRTAIDAIVRGDTPPNSGQTLNVQMEL